MKMWPLVSIALLLVPPRAFADVIELKTGQRVEGTLKQATPASVSVEVGGQTITFEGDKVRAIYFGTAPQAVAAQPLASQEAIRALKGLHSVVQGGVTYRDYGPGSATRRSSLIDTLVVIPATPQPERR